jgi:hypothetical protein
MAVSICIPPVSSRRLFQARIGGIPQAVAEKIEPQHGDEDSDTGAER